MTSWQDEHHENKDSQAKGECFQGTGSDQNDRKETEDKGRRGWNRHRTKNTSAMSLRVYGEIPLPKIEAFFFNGALV